MTTAEVRIVDLDGYEPTDAEIVSWWEMMTAPDQLRWEYDDTWAETPTTARNEIDSFRKWQTERGDNYPFWAFVGERVAGMIGVNRGQGPARRHSGEIGYGVAAAFTRQGIGSQLLAAAIQKARQVGLLRLEANCFEDNEASIALLRKFGFQEEGTRVGAICKDGELRNEKLFALLL